MVSTIPLLLGLRQLLSSNPRQWEHLQDYVLPPAHRRHLHRGQWGEEQVVQPIEEKKTRVEKEGNEDIIDEVDEAREKEIKCINAEDHIEIIKFRK